MFCQCCANEAVRDIEKVAGDSDDYLNVMIVGARGIRNSDWMPGLGKPDCYCEVRAIGAGATEEPLFVTQVLEDTLAPMWREEAPLHAYQANQALQFKIWDKDVVGSDYLGKVEIQPGSFDTTGFNGELPLEEAGAGVEAYLRLKIKPAHKPYPRPSATPKIEVEIKRRSKSVSWGLSLDMQDEKKAYITHIAAGPFQDYNDGQDNHDLKVRATDFITAVNGKTTHLLEELKASKEAKVTIRRGLDLIMIVEKGEESVTSEFSRKFVSDGGLVIKAIGDQGMIKAHNDQTEDETLKFQVRDRIVKVDGKTGNTKDLFKMLEHAQGKFHVNVIRCATDDNRSAEADRWSFYN